MKFDKGTIKNINKKILAGALSLALVTSGLVGCSTTELNSFEYTTDEQGQCVAEGAISYENLDDAYFLVIENSKYDKVEYYIAFEHKLVINYYYYYDILSDKKIYDERTNDENRNLIVCDKLYDYLYVTENIKNEYTVEDVEQILEELKTNYEKENNKQLVKGK